MINGYITVGSNLLDAIDRLGIENASSVPQLTDTRNLLFFGPGRCADANEALIVALENKVVLRVARVG